MTRQEQPRARRHLLVTGGAGFIGSAYVRMILERRDGTVVTVLDKLTYAGNEANLRSSFDDEEMGHRLRFVRGDIADATAVAPLASEADAIVNFAAESHVDRSILDPEAFLRTGVLGVHVLLEALRRESERAANNQRSRPRMLQVSTDEVYGSIEEGFADESALISPRSPYAAAKAAGDLLVLSYWSTFGLDVVITRGANTYGPHQHPEKFIPLFITNAIDSMPVPLYGDGLQRRAWLHVTDHAAAIDSVLQGGTSGVVYNIPGGDERTNLDVATRLLAALDRPSSLIRSVTDRPGHDRRYAMDGARIAGLGWQPRIGFEEGLEATVEWFVANEGWWRAVRSGEWDAYYARQYGGRLAASNGG